MITLIAALDQAGGIGKGGELLCYLPADLRHFKASTLGKPIIMGNTTFQSLGKPLPQRKNIVLSRRENISADNVTYAHTPDEALAACDGAPEVMVIGGAMIYRLFLPIADKLILTHIAGKFDADVFFPDIKWQEWILETEVHYNTDDKNHYPFDIRNYVRK